MTTGQQEPVEEMAAFFDLRATGYDAHMRGYVFTEVEFARFYQALAAPISPADAPLQILDLGCGTGLEIEAILAKAPDAQITGIDISRNMLDLLAMRYAAHMEQITLFADSYLTLPLAPGAYDYIVSAMSIHHLLHDTKLALYKKIRVALKPGGIYIEGDSVTTAEMEEQFLAEYHDQMRSLPEVKAGHYHIDVPLSIASQESLLAEAGFQDFELLWQKDSTAEWNLAVYTASRAAEC